MLRPFCRCKIHRATITDASLNYMGSMTIPAELMKELDIREGEQVEIANVDNGARWTTYAIPGKKGAFCLNGAAARMGCVGDRVIIMVYCLLNEQEVTDHRMKIAFMDENNKAVKIQK